MSTANKNPLIRVRPETRRKLNEIVAFDRRTISETVDVIVDEAMEKRAIRPATRDRRPNRRQTATA